MDQIRLKNNLRHSDCCVEVGTIDVRFGRYYNSIAAAIRQRRAIARKSPMLSLASESSARWLAQVDQHLPEILIDHAHCEKKAAGVALNLIFAYVDRVELCRELSGIVEEELDHFRQVLDLLERRNIRFKRLAPGGYGRKLNELVRKLEPARAVDRLLVAGLIEARSCERFDLLRRHVQDPELAAFYGSLFESEAQASQHVCSICEAIRAGRCGRQASR